MKWDAGSMPEKKVRFGEFELDLGRFQLYRSGVSRAWNAFLCNFADGSDQKAGSVATARKLPTRFAAIVRPPLESRTARTCRCGTTESWPLKAKAGLSDGKLLPDLPVTPATVEQRTETRRNGGSCATFSTRDKGRTVRRDGRRRFWRGRGQCRTSCRRSVGQRRRAASIRFGDCP